MTQHTRPNIKNLYQKRSLRETLEVNQTKMTTDANQNSLTADPDKNRSQWAKLAMIP